MGEMPEQRPISAEELAQANSFPSGVTPDDVRSMLETQERVSAVEANDLEVISEYFRGLEGPPVTGEQIDARKEWNRKFFREAIMPNAVADKQAGQVAVTLTDQECERWFGHSKLNLILHVIMDHVVSDSLPGELLPVRCVDNLAYEDGKHRFTMPLDLYERMVAAQAVSPDTLTNGINAAGNARVSEKEIM